MKLRRLMQNRPSRDKAYQRAALCVTAKLIVEWPLGVKKRRTIAPTEFAGCPPSSPKRPNLCDAAKRRSVPCMDGARGARGESDVSVAASPAWRPRKKKERRQVQKFGSVWIAAGVKRAPFMSALFMRWKPNCAVGVNSMS
jgi:hypothetical protein